MFKSFQNIVPRKKGSAAIYGAIRQFQDIAKQIEDGVKDNESEKARNNDRIEVLNNINRHLDEAAKTGRIVAAKLRDLVS